MLTFSNFITLSWPSLSIEGFIYTHKLRVLDYYHYTCSGPMVSHAGKYLLEGNFLILEYTLWIYLVNWMVVIVWKSLLMEHAQMTCGWRDYVVLRRSGVHYELSCLVAGCLHDSYFKHSQVWQADLQSWLSIWNYNRKSRIINNCLLTFQCNTFYCEVVAHIVCTQ